MQRVYCAIFLMIRTFLVLLTKGQSGAYGMYDFVLSISFHFKSLVLLQFLVDHSDFCYQKKTRHIVPPRNKSRISKFSLQFMEFHELQISLKLNSPKVFFFLFVFFLFVFFLSF